MPNLTVKRLKQSIKPYKLPLIMYHYIGVNNPNNNKRLCQRLAEISRCIYRQT